MFLDFEFTTVPNSAAELGVYNGDVMWLSFVASAVAAVSLQYIDPFGTAKLVLFQVTGSDEPWRFFELIPWGILGVIGVSLT